MLNVACSLAKMILIVESEDNTSTHPDAVVDEIVQAGPNTISYLPACDEWQKSLCQFLGMTFVRRNITHILQPIEFSIFHQPATTVRILGDGNCFFRALAFVITGSQDEHQELRTMTTTYMQHNAGILSCYLDAYETMDEYLARTDMHSLSVWATEIEIFAASSNMLQTPILVFCKSGLTYKWLQFSPHHCEDSGIVGRRNTFQ